MHRIRSITLSITLSLILILTAVGSAQAQDPAYVNARGGNHYDPLRAGSPPPPVVPAASGGFQPQQPAAGGDTLSQVEALRQQLAQRLQDGGNGVGASDRNGLAQLLEESGAMVQQARAGDTVGSDAGPNPLDFNAVQNDPRVQAGAQQAKAAMQTLERSVLPLLQEFKNRFDAELAARSNRR